MRQKQWRCILHTPPELIARVREELQKNPRSNIKVEMTKPFGRKLSEFEWTPEEAQEKVDEYDVLQQHCPVFHQEMGDAAIRKLGVPLEDGKRAFKRLDCKVNGKSVYPRNYTAAWVLLGVGVCAAAYGIYSYVAGVSEQRAPEEGVQQPA